MAKKEIEVGFSSICIEESVFNEFVKRYPDPQVQEQVATMQIAKLLGPPRQTPELQYTTVALSKEQREFLEREVVETGVTRKEILTQLIWDLELAKVTEVFGRSYFFRKDEHKRFKELKNVSFSPNKETYERWSLISRESAMSKQMVISTLIDRSMKERAAA